MPERSVFADCKPGDWIVTSSKSFMKIDRIGSDGDIEIGKYCRFRRDGTGHVGPISLTARPASLDEVADHLEREAERKRKWDEEQAAEQRLERIRDAAPAMLAALKAILFQVVQGKVLERDACITQAREALALAEPPPIS